MMSDGLSEDEFRKVLYDTLQKKGLVSGLKTHLRQQLTLHINQSSKSQEQTSNRAELVGDLLTAAHLKYAKYDYTLSTFITEARISTEKYFSLSEWVRLLNISEESTLYRMLDDRGEVSPLLSFLNAVVLSCGNSLMSIGCQTESVTLQDKLHSLDQHYSRLPSDQFLPLEDKHLIHGFTETKQTEEIIKLQIERFKELELERIKLSERERCNNEYNKKVTELEEDYRQRLDALHRRETESAHTHDAMIRETEATLYKDRQSLLSELESLRSRSLQLEREKELLKSQAGLEKEKSSVAAARLEERAINISQRESDLENRLKEEGERVRLQCKASLRERETQAATKEHLLQDEAEERIRNIAELEAAREQCSALRKETAGLEDRCMLLEAQLDAARSQALHHEAKLTILSDYDQIKQRTTDLETERRHLLESVEKERTLSKKQESQLHEIISSLREQLSRPSKSESQLSQQMSKLKQSTFKELSDLKNQLTTAHNELRREQQSRLTAQSELREQFLQCRSNHVQAPPVTNTKDFPDFLKRYLSSVNVNAANAGTDNDISENSQHCSEGAISSVSSISTPSTHDSYFNPTKNIVASSRRVFEELEEEEKKLEREFQHFKKKTDVMMPIRVEEPNIVAKDNSLVSILKPVEVKSVKFESTEKYYDPPAKVSSSLVPAERTPTTPQQPTQQPPQQPTQQPPQQPTEQSTNDIMEGVNPNLQKYMGQVIAAKAENKAAQARPPTPDKSTSISEPIQFDKSDSDFSW